MKTNDFILAFALLACNERSGLFELPRADVKLPRPRRKRIITDEQRRQARARMESIRKAVSCSRGQLN